MLAVLYPMEARFIPARAGNRHPVAYETGGVTVHPRACGEQPGASAMPSKYAGSSPRVRGTVYVEGLMDNFIRFIPARAGNSIGAPVWYAFSSVHPRACGEQTCGFVCIRSCCGSSPRVRGTER